MWILLDALCHRSTTAQRLQRFKVIVQNHCQRHINQTSFGKFATVLMDTATCLVCLSLVHRNCLVQQSSQNVFNGNEMERNQQKNSETQCVRQIKRLKLK